MSLLGLVMIVKNEVRRLGSVLASFKPFIDHWTILDTGSTDGTQELIRHELADIPGTLYEEPFVDFSTSRNRALDLHDRSTTFTIMPNGDVLLGGAELRSFLETRKDDSAGAYRVRVAPGHYYHPFVMRTGAGWRYKGRTHECAMGSNTGPTIPCVALIRDRGSRTDAEWRERWIRDLALLNRDREDDPTNPRPYFYLGQTHECLGQYEDALAFFERRASLGGYFDEVFEAKLRIGKMKAKLGRPWPEIQQAYLEAYAHDSRRAEPLHAISEYWHSKEQHAVTRIFAVPAAQLPKPSTDLFLDEEVYSWRAADLAAVSSFYAGHRDDGRYFANKAVKACPNDMRLRNNRAFFVEPAAQLFSTYRIRPLEFQPEPPYVSTNPSIYFDGLRWRCLIRTTNFRLIAGQYRTLDGSPVNTRNYMAELDDNLNITHVTEMVDRVDIPRTDFPVHGFEDCRLFKSNGMFHCTATVCDFNNGQRQLVLLTLGSDYSFKRADVLDGPWRVHPQKNWMPLVSPSEDARFIYSIDPPVVLHWTGNQIDAGDCKSFIPGRLRGGSQAVKTQQGWLCLVHDVTFADHHRTYLHRFVLLSEAFQVIGMSDLFYFQKRGIEFCAGLAHDGRKLVASFGVSDQSACLGVFDLYQVLSSIRSDYVI